MKKLLIIGVMLLLVGCGNGQGSDNRTDTFLNMTSENNQNDSTESIIDIVEPTPEPTIPITASEEEMKAELLKFQSDLNAAAGIELNNIDAQYDKIGNLDTAFGFIGKATLDDYYNYGYRGTEEMFFCVRVTPIDGDDWYIYALRPDYFDNANIKADAEELFNNLKTNDELYVHVMANITSSNYKDNQGNLATGWMYEISKLKQ